MTYQYSTGVKYNRSMVKVILFVMGALFGAVIGLYVCAQCFPLSTQETVYIRSER